MRPAIFAAVASALVGGCAGTHSRYVTPALTVQRDWTTGPAQVANVAAKGQWWHAFGDPRLDVLVDRVLVRNPSLIAAAVRVRRAQLQTGLAANALLPQLSGGVSGNTSTGSGGNNRDGGTTAASTGGSSTSFGTNLGAAWEVDLFNRLGSLRDAAGWEAAATEEDRQAARLSVIGTAVSTYFLRVERIDRLALADASLVYARRTRDLVEVQYRAGFVSGLERAEASRQLAVQEGDRTQIVQSLVEANNALTALLDGEPASPAAGGVARVALPPVESGLPIGLLARRPDLRSAEARLRGSLANVDATTASFYPNFTLTGSGSAGGTNLGSILSNPIGSLLGSVAMPFLNVERARLTRGVSRTTFDEGVATFRQTFVQAVRDVDTALSARGQLIAQGARLDVAVTAARTAERLSEVRYRSGAIALRDWLATQELRRQAESAQLTNRLALLTNHVQLIQALGGDQPRETPVLSEPTSSNLQRARP